MKVNVSEWNRHVSGLKVGLVLTPGDPPDVDTFVHVGAGTPESVWHRRALMLDVPTDADPESVEEWVQGHEEEITSLLAEYRGDRWDGHNHVGTWEGDDKEVEGEHETWEEYQDARDAMADASLARGERVGELEADLAENVRQFYDPDDWFVDGLSDEDVKAFHEDADGWAENLVLDAAGNGAALDKDEVKEWAQLQIDWLKGME
jgi:hypothetical protein